MHAHISSDVTTCDAELCRDCTIDEPNDAVKERGCGGGEGGVSTCWFARTNRGKPDRYALGYNNIHYDNGMYRMFTKLFHNF